MKWWVAYLCCLAFGALALIIYGCSTSLPAQGGGGGGGTGGGLGTGPCSPDGLTRACHLVTGETQGILNCYEGTQTCKGGAWGPCAGSGTLVTHSFTPVLSGGDLRPQVFGPSADAGGCATDPCDPYCIGFDDNGDGGGGVVSGGGIVGANYNTLPGGFQQNKHGCHGAVNNADGGIVSYDEGCQTPTPLGTCNDCSQGDMCCPLNTGIADTDDDDCVPWSTTGVLGVGTCEAPPGCSGPDFTVGTGCVSGVGDTLFPVCNRGTQPANTGTVRLGISNGPPGGNHDCLNSGGACGGCGNFEGRGFCDIDLTQDPIAVQGCVEIDIDNPANSFPPAGVTCTGVNSSGNLSVLINENGAGTCGAGTCVPTIAECDECNNWSARKVNATCGLLTAPPPTNATFTYTAVCPDGSHPFWNQFAYNINNSADGTVTFTATTTPLEVDGGVGTPTAGPFTIATAPPSPGTCPTAGPPPCPITLDGADGGAGVFPLPADTNEILTLTINVTTASDPPPDVTSWQISYDCIPTE